MLDATRTDDGNHVMLKKFAPSSGTAEAEIALLFSGEPHLSNPKNHCIPTTVLGVPDEEDVQLLVMPLLQSWEEPKFDTIGEVVDFFHQVFEVSSLCQVVVLNLTLCCLGASIYAFQWCSSPVSIDYSEEMTN